MAFWKVVYELEVAEQLKRDFAAGLITQEDISLFKIWANEIEEHGYEYIQRSRLWDDHPLERKWAGYRSSCFSRTGRIIYGIESDKGIVHVVRITVSHDYERGEMK